MDKGYYETFHMKEYQLLKVISHKWFERKAELALENEFFIGNRFVKHWHRSLELFYVVNNGCTVWKNGKTRKLYDDDLEIINSGEPHEYYDFQDGSQEGCSVIISYSFLKELFPEFDDWYFVIKKDIPAYEKLTEIIMKMCEVSDSDDSWKILVLRSLLYELLYILITYFKFEKKEIIDIKTQKYEERYKSILEYIKRHYNEKISLSKISEHFALSPEYFSRSFKKYTGITFTQYVKSLRVENAKKLIINSDLSIIDISYLVGEPDVKTLIMDFKQEMLMTPNQFRKMNKDILKESN